MSQAPLTRAYDEVVAFFAGAPTKEQIAGFKLSDEAKSRVRDLLRKNSEGTLTPDESDELDACVQLDRMVMLIRARRVSKLNPRSTNERLRLQSGGAGAGERPALHSPRHAI